MAHHSQPIKYFYRHHQEIGLDVRSVSFYFLRVFRWIRQQIQMACAEPEYRGMRWVIIACIGILSGTAAGLEVKNQLANRIIAGVLFAVVTFIAAIPMAITSIKLTINVRFTSLSYSNFFISG
jgi:hypothetical protein